MKKKVLFVSSGDSIRSQIAAGFLKEKFSDRFEVHTAGPFTFGYIHPRAIMVMQEMGIDISGHTFQLVEEFEKISEMDYIITLCEPSQRTLPKTSPHTTLLHWPFPDVTRNWLSHDEVMVLFRELRDNLKTKVESWGDSVKA